jgi:hypothetical protein
MMLPLRNIWGRACDVCAICAYSESCCQDCMAWIRVAKLVMCHMCVQIGDMMPGFRGNDPDVVGMEWYQVRVGRLGSEWERCTGDADLERTACVCLLGAAHGMPTVCMHLACNEAVILIQP